MRLIACALLSLTLVACQTAPINPTGEALDTKGLAAKCKPIPGLTEQANSSEAAFLQWLADFVMVYEDCATRQRRLVEVLQRNRVLQPQE